MSRSKEMRRVLSRWRRSGQSLRRFGLDEGISYNTLQYWRRKLEGTGPSRPRRGPGAMPEFVPVDVIAEAKLGVPSGVGFEVHLHSGHRIQVPVGFAAEELRRLVAVLASC